MAPTRMTPVAQSSLTTTSYAILGQLAMRPWTMYDLARHMRENVQYFFPRAESQVYAEPKRLVSLGLANWHAEATGRRKRTVYEITEAGRAELRRWLERPPSRGPMLEFEALLRVFVTDPDSIAGLRRTLEAVRAEVATTIEAIESARSTALEGRSPFPDRVATRVMAHDFLMSFADLVDRWAERSQSRVDTWSDLDAETQSTAALEALRGQTRTDH